MTKGKTPPSTHGILWRLMGIVAVTILGCIVTSAFIGAGLDIVRNHPQPGHVIKHPAFGVVSILIGVLGIIGVLFGTYKLIRSVLRRYQSGI